MLERNFEYAGHEYLEESSPVITKPADPESVKLLEQKLQQYDEWLEEMKRRDQRRPPNSRQDTTVTQRWYGKQILTALLIDGEVKTFDFAHKLYQEQGNKFDSPYFGGACKIIDRYTQDKNYLKESIEKQVLTTLTD